MSESADYDPSPWRGTIDHFASAKQAYQHHASRTYDSVRSVSSSSVDVGDYVPERLETDVEIPIVLVVDMTGSMEDWPGTIFSKLPYLDNELKEYYGEGKYAVSFACIDDVCTQAIPFQARPFVSGVKMKEELEQLKHTRNGGGNMRESYDVAALYYARNCEMPKALKPLMVFLGDEGLYEFVDRNKGVQWARASVSGRLSIPDLFEELKQKFSVYVIHKPYGISGAATSDVMSGTDIAVRKEWAAVLGDDHIADLGDPNRVVDVLFGIFAKETGKIDYFRQELQDRQMKDANGKPDPVNGPKKIKIVLKSLATIHNDPANADPAAPKQIAAPGKSITRRGDGKSRASKSLMD